MNPIEFLPLVAIAALFWFLLIRPQTKRARQLRELQRALRVGDEVVLTSGFYATVRAVAEDRLSVELGPGTTVTVAPAAVAMLQPAREPEPGAGTPDTDPDTEETR